MPGFGQDPPRYQKAVNKLLGERLIDGKKDEGGRMAIALNPQRLVDVRRELRPWYLRPTIWLGALVCVSALLVALFIL